MGFERAEWLFWIKWVLASIVGGMAGAFVGSALMALDLIVTSAQGIAVGGAVTGAVLGPSHATQAGTPPENVVAFFDAALSVYPHQR